MEITYLTDQKVVDKFTTCGICFHKNGHSEWCATISKDNARASEWSNIVQGLALVKKDLLLDDLQEAGAILAGHYAYEEAKKVREEEEKAAALKKQGEAAHRVRVEVFPTHHNEKKQPLTDL